MEAQDLLDRLGVCGDSRLRSVSAIQAASAAHLAAAMSSSRRRRSSITSQASPAPMASPTMMSQTSKAFIGGRPDRASVDRPPSAERR